MSATRRQPIAPMRRAAGFAYLSLIILVAIIGIASAASLQVGGLLGRRAAEEELLDIGAEFRAALISYAATTPAGQMTMPQTLQDLIKDPRYPNVRRHLRKLYVDPITGVEGWGTLTAPSAAGVGIVGVYSLSTAAPIKVGNFDEPFKHFQNKTSYQDWKFMAQSETDLAESGALAAPAAAPPVAAPPASPKPAPPRKK
ncbi:type II secretory pathway pseudopilin PulG [Actimicrobium sp. GrIS 1.19]|uniref:type II secretion system protein n=1 Tax=Actimicrobium sp. GrIS 1.19 TaxID=3071708 RepID=UPI002E0594C2|nr:type II secretory pathway pseudopilin PulG [Actimicrobium sp. GrIS 1.19]